MRKLYDFSKGLPNPYKGRLEKVVEPARVTVRVKLDADVIGWLKAHGANSDIKVNQVLRRAMEKELSGTRRRES